MKTLYININGENIQSSDDVIVIGKPENALINKFHFELGNEIKKGVFAPDVRQAALINGFMSQYKTIYEEKILPQLDAAKYLMLSQDHRGKYSIQLPQEYIEWLNYNGESVYSEIAKSLKEKGGVVEINLERIYRNGISLLINSIESGDYGQLVVNDNAVTRRSVLVRSIKTKFENLAFVLFEKWMENLARKNKQDQKPAESDDTKNGTTTSDSNIYTCDICGWNYVPERGCLDVGVIPGTLFEDLPEDFECPICGSDKGFFSSDEIDNTVKQSIEVSNEFDCSMLFPVHEIILGKTNIKGLAKSAKLEKVDAGWRFDIIPNLFLVIQSQNENFISELVIKNGTNKKFFPKGWEHLLGFSFGASKQKCLNEMRKRGFKIIQNASENDYDAISLDARYKVNLFFYFDVLDFLAVSLLRCPYCSSFDNELQNYINEKEIVLKCNNCEHEWGECAGLHNS